jgi:hypothetical protein
LADNGIGFYQSLKRAGKNVKNDLDGIQKVIDGHLSAKGDLRGNGIKDTIKLLSNRELNGYDYVPFLVETF